jgi:hypothetical protein
MTPDEVTATPAGFFEWWQKRTAEPLDGRIKDACIAAGLIHVGRELISLTEKGRLWRQKIIDERSRGRRFLR